MIVIILPAHQVIIPRSEIRGVLDDHSNQRVVVTCVGYELTISTYLFGTDSILLGKFIKDLIPLSDIPDELDITWEAVRDSHGYSYHMSRKEGIRKCPASL